MHRPVSDTWMLADALLAEDVRGRTVADLCTGTGALALVAARAGAASVVAVDVSLRALASARLNARLHGLALDVRRGDLLTALEGERVDVIVSNPPYLPAPTDRLPRHRAAVALDAGRDGRALLDRICRDAPAHLRPGGALLLVHSSVCDEGRTCVALRERGLQAAVVARHRGRLGPRLTARSSLLRERGLLRPGEAEEDIVVVRARAPLGPGRAERAVAGAAGAGS